MVIHIYIYKQNIISQFYTEAIDSVGTGFAPNLQIKNWKPKRPNMAVKMNLRTPLGWNIGRPLAQEFVSLHVACLNAQNFVVYLPRKKHTPTSFFQVVTLFRPKNVTSSGLWSVFHVGNQSSLKNARYPKLTPRTCQVAASLFKETIFTSSGVRGSSDPVFHRLGYTGKI